MIALSQARTQRLLAVHGWSGTILGLFLYVVVLTGTIAVLAHEIGVWSAGGVTLEEPLSVPVDEIVKAQIESTPEKWHEEIGVFQSLSGNLRVWMHTHDTHPESGNIEDYGRLVEVDPVSREIVSDQEGWARDVFRSDPKSALERFILDLHITLHLPRPWGLYATGILGFVMLLAAITGLLIHRHLIKEAFLAPRGSGKLLTRRDRHVLAGTWSLIFAFVLAFTGAFFSFAASLALPVVAATGFGGDQQAMIESLIGVQAEEDPTVSALASLDTMKATAQAELGSIPSSLSISNYGRADARVVMAHPPADGGLTGKQVTFNGSTGEYLGEKPPIGTAPSAGAGLITLMAPLDFGNFAGLLSKAVWVALGIAMTYVTFTGLQLWVRRREAEPLWQGFGHWVSVVGVGTPLALALCAHVFFVALHLGVDAAYWTALGFVIPSVLIVMLGIVRRRQSVQLEVAMAWCLAAALLMLPLTRILTGGPDWAMAMAGQDGIVVGMDLLMVIMGALVMLWQSPGLRQRLASIGILRMERPATA